MRSSDSYVDRKLFPDVDSDNLPQEVEGWIRHYCHHGDEGALRLRDLLRALDDLGFEAAQRRRLQEHFATTDPRISEDQIDKFLYNQRPMRLGTQRLELVTRYLWDAGILPRATVEARKSAADILRDLHASLVGFLDVAESSIIELEERLPGKYWIYRPAALDPGKYVRGLLTVNARVVPGGPLSMSEDYRVPADAGAGKHGLRELYEGLTLQKSHRPFMLSSLKVPTLRSKPQSELQHADVAVLRVTLIATAHVHEDGKVASMVGFTAASCVTSGFVASPVCFERIPLDYQGTPEQELRLLPAEQLPSSVLGWLHSFVAMHGLVRL